MATNRSRTKWASVSTSHALERGFYLFLVPSISNALINPHQMSFSQVHVRCSSGEEVIDTMHTLLSSPFSPSLDTVIQGFHLSFLLLPVPLLSLSLGSIYSTSAVSLSLFLQWWWSRLVWLVNKESLAVAWSILYTRKRLFHHPGNPSHLFNFRPETCEAKWALPGNQKQGRDRCRNQ